MKTFKLGCHVTVSGYTEVAANSLEEAIEIASNREVGLGVTGSGNEPDEMWLIEDADGSPREIHSIEG